MIRDWVLIFAAVALVAGFFGLSGLFPASARIARILFYIFAAILLILLGLAVFGIQRLP